ncbi:hypothetical protein L0959_19470 [Paracidovorax citrulli]
MPTVNYALEARTQLALYRVVRPLNQLKAMEHYSAAMSFAFKAYSHGQSRSVYLVDDLWLLDHARWDWEFNNPLRTNFVGWMAEVIENFPGIGLNAQLSRYDQLTPVEWFYVGDRASCVDGAHHLNMAYQSAQKRLGKLWCDAVVEVTKHADEFCEKAAARQEMKGILRIDYVNLGILTALAGCAEKNLELRHCRRPHLQGSDLQ